MFIQYDYNKIEQTGHNSAIPAGMMILAELKHRAARKELVLCLNLVSSAHVIQSICKNVYHLGKEEKKIVFYPFKGKSSQQEFTKKNVLF